MRTRAPFRAFSAGVMVTLFAALVSGCALPEINIETVDTETVDEVDQSDAETDADWEPQVNQDVTPTPDLEGLDPRTQAELRLLEQMLTTRDRCPDLERLIDAGARREDAIDLTIRVLGAAILGDSERELSGEGAIFASRYLGRCPLTSGDLRRLHDEATA